jgi:hypothetical protein
VNLARTVLLTVVLAAAAAGLGAWGGVRYAVSGVHTTSSIDEVLHHRLHLTADQTKRIEGLEREFAARRVSLDAEMRAANAQLAEAYSKGHAYTPQVQAAIDRFHRAMGELQKASISHVIAMRAVLRPDQTTLFDDTVVTALTQARS